MCYYRGLLAVDAIVNLNCFGGRRHDFDCLCFEAQHMACARVHNFGWKESVVVGDARDANIS
jgi:hypothetical protein